MGFWPAFLPEPSAMMVSRQKIRQYITSPALHHLSPDIELLPAALDIIHQSQGATEILAHAVRLVKMSTQTLARKSYPAYMDYRNAIRMIDPRYFDSGTQQVWVPVYSVFSALRFSESPGWVVGKWRSGGTYVIGSAVRTKGRDALAAAVRAVEQYRLRTESKSGVLIDKQPDLPVQWFAKPPLASDPDAVAVESLWRTVKEKYPNEVTLAEMSV